MKDEYKGISINKFVELKSKMHSMFSDDGEESNIAKGVNTASEFKEYENDLLNREVMRHKMRKIRVLMIKDLF